MCLYVCKNAHSTYAKFRRCARKRRSFRNIQIFIQSSHPSGGRPFPHPVEIYIGGCVSCVRDKMTMSCSAPGYLEASRTLNRPSKHNWSKIQTWRENAEAAWAECDRRTAQGWNYERDRFDGSGDRYCEGGLFYLGRWHFFIVYVDSISQWMKWGTANSRCS